MLSLRVLVACALAGAASLLLAEERKPAAPADDGFKPMFNGKNLDGWVNANCAPGTFFVKGDEIVTTGEPTGFLRTDKQNENFVLEMDWMHVNKTEVGISGLFVWGDPLPGVGTPYTRGIEVQVLVNLEYKDKKTGAVTASSHGDVFAIHGAKCVPDRPHPTGGMRCIPSENRAKGGGEWNHYKVTANDGAIKLEVNGKEVSGVSKCNPRKGYLALESEGAECHFKNIKIKELPSTNPKPDECARVAEGHVSLFNGIDLKGWTAEKDAWKVKGGVLKATGEGNLVGEKKYGNCELVFDWKVPAKAEGSVFVTAQAGPVNVMLRPATGGVIAGGGRDLLLGNGEAKTAKTGTWNRSIITFDGATLTYQVNGETALKTEMLKEFAAKLTAGPITLAPAEGLEIMNVFVRELKK